MRKSRRTLCRAESGFSPYQSSDVCRYDAVSSALGVDVRRREFLGALSAAAVWPHAARAQQVVPAIGWLGGTSFQPQHVIPFTQGLKAEGYTEGQNVVVEYRWADGRYERLPTFVDEYVKRQVSVIAAQNSAAARVAKSETETVPTVFMTGSDPVQLGLVASMNRPGGNRTGVHLVTHTLDAKRLELLRELVPTATTIAALLNPNNPSADYNKTNVLTAARMIGLQIRIINVASENELNAAFAELVRSRRFDQLWDQPCRCVSSAWRLRRPHPEGNQAK